MKYKPGPHFNAVYIEARTTLNNVPKESSRPVVPDVNNRLVSGVESVYQLPKDNNSSTGQAYAKHSTHTVRHQLTDFTAR